ncbi:hypothetical protein SAMN02745673_04324 [Marinactinospora thermotolerans DSM 45154]|uniref:Uncharacterized protein n=1 Tax=Marinactinospora thermotolerans DSM 45154 TaxID=1122192 RepID=A0A1T4T244_9ACTN|nr:hypothetical protein SAMN02745673_04324 [Marinactinospora thermotolerans DSM 45154]
MATLPPEVPRPAPNRPLTALRGPPCTSPLLPLVLHTTIDGAPGARPFAPSSTDRTVRSDGPSDATATDPHSTARRRRWAMRDLLPPARRPRSRAAHRRTASGHVAPVPLPQACSPRSSATVAPGSLGVRAPPPAPCPRSGRWHLRRPGRLSLRVPPGPRPLRAELPLPEGVPAGRLPCFHRTGATPQPRPRRRTGARRVGGTSGPSPDRFPRAGIRSRRRRRSPVPAGPPWCHRAAAATRPLWLVQRSRQHRPDARPRTTGARPSPAGRARHGAPSRSVGSVIRPAPGLPPALPPHLTGLVES